MLLYRSKAVSQIAKNIRSHDKIAQQDEYNSQLRSVVGELFGSGYCWERIDEGSEVANRNALLTPVAADSPVTASEVVLCN